MGNAASINDVDIRTLRPQFQDGEIEARPDWKELLPTKQDALEFVGKMVARSAATAVMGPIMEGIEALQSISAVRDAMSVYGEIIDLAERLQDVKGMLSKEVCGKHYADIQKLCEKKQKGQDIRAKYEELMEYFDEVSSSSYPKSGKFYHIKNKVSGNYLQVGSHGANGQRMLFTSTKKAVNTAFALVHTNRKGVVVLESLQFPGKCVWPAGGSRSENSNVLLDANSGADAAQVGGQWRLVASKVKKNGLQYFKLKNKHSMLFLMPFCCIPNPNNPMVQGFGTDGHSEWLFEEVE